jgi:hypothetical protein
LDGDKKQPVESFRRDILENHQLACERGAERMILRRNYLYLEYGARRVLHGVFTRKIVI